MEKLNGTLKGLVFLIVGFVSSLSLAQGQLETRQSFYNKAEIFWKSFTPSIGLRSFNDLGRDREMNDPAGRRLKSKNEYFISAKTQEGWGVVAQFVETPQWRGPQGRSTFSAADPSIAISHPIYKNEKVLMTGLLREYFPVSDGSITAKQYQQAYYLNLTVKMKNNTDFFNQLIPRYFSQPTYKPSDSTLYVEDYSTFSKQGGRWFRYGLGQHSQLELHPVTPTGTVVDLYPFVDFMVSSKIYFGPRVYLPVFVTNTVYDAARNVSLAEAQAEFYIQAVL